MCNAGEGKKKKKKKKPKKKSGGSSHKVEQQTEPPTVGLSKLFPDGNYPEGELQDYKDECVSCRAVFTSSTLSSTSLTLHTHTATPIAQPPKKHATTSA